MKADEAIKWAGIAGIAYLLYTLVDKLNKVGQTAADVGNQTAEIFDVAADPTGLTFAGWYDPTSRIVIFYWLTFPDGNHHAVWANDVNADGTFLRDNAPYRIGVDKAGGLRAYAYGG